MSTISSIVSARIRPDWQNIAPTAASLAANVAVWLPAARDPACVRRGGATPETGCERTA
jgi:hypothetical protein